jgi:WD40 repeat protein
MTTPAEPSSAPDPGCPPVEALERAAALGRAEGPLAEHLRRCHFCRESFDQKRADVDFAARLGRELFPAHPGPAPGRDHSGRPERVAGFVIHGEIARGAQGVVYEATQSATNRRVALKLLRPFVSGGGRGVRRLEREAELAGQLRHPNIVTIYSGERLPDERYAIAMEHIEGVPLDIWRTGVDASAPATRQGRVAGLTRKLGVFLKICDAIAYAHRHGVMHRDLKPSNVLVDAGDEPHVLDFGVARRIAEGSAHAITLPGDVACTLAYASPEQVSGDPARIDTRTDVYSLGVILYELLAGRGPYPATGPLQEIIKRITSLEPPPPSRRADGSRDPHVGPDLDTIVLHAIEKDKHRRYQSVDDLGADVRAFVDGRPVAARSHSTFYVIRKNVRRHIVPIAVALAALAGLSAYAVTAGVLLARSQRAREDTQTAQERTAAALTESNIERGRLQAKAGSIAQAEEILWRELLAARPDLSDDRMLFRAPPEVLRPAWALVELFSRSPRRELGLSEHAPVVAEWTAAGITLVHNPPARAVVQAVDLPMDSGPPGPLGPSTSVSRDGRVVAVHDADRSGVSLVDTASGRTLLNIEAAPGDRVHLSDDGALAVLCRSDSTGLCVIDSSGALLAARPTSSRALAAGFSPDASLVALLDGREVVVWDWRARVDRARLPFDEAFARVALRPDAAAGALEWSRDGSLIAVRLANCLALGQASAGGSMRTFACLSNAVSVLRFSPDSSRLAAAARDRVVRVFDVASARQIAEHVRLPADVVGMAFSPAGDELAVSDTAGSIEVWDMAPRRWFRAAPVVTGLPSPGLLQATLSPDGSTIAGAAWSHAVLWRWPGLERLESIRIAEPGAQAAPVPVSAVRWAPGARVLTGTYEGHVDVWDTNSRRHVASLAREGAVVGDIAVHPTGGLAAWVAGSGPLRVWDLERHEQIAALPSPLRSTRTSQLAWSPDGACLAQSCVDTPAPAGVVLWDTRTWAPRARLRGHTATARAVTFAPDSATVATGGDDQTIRLWNTAEGAQLRVIAGLPADVFALAYHPEGKLLFAGTRDSSVRVYDARTGSELAVLEGHAGPVFSLQCSPDGCWLITASDDQTLGAWDLGAYMTHLRGNARARRDVPAR